MIVKKQAQHVHRFGSEVFEKTVPIRQAIKDGGKTVRDIMTAKDTIYYRKCEGEHCKETLAFHMKRRKL